MQGPSVFETLWDFFVTLMLPALIIVWPISVLLEWGKFKKIKDQDPKLRNATYGEYMRQQILMRDEIAVERAARRSQDDTKRTTNTAISTDRILENSDERARCPFCAEMILKQAKLCQFCKSDIPDDWPPPNDDTQAQKGDDKI